MKISGLIVPDGMFNDIYEITTEVLASFGKKGVIFDIDNTVAPYETIHPTEQMKEYFRQLVENGLKIAFVSNNKSNRADVFNEELGFFCVSNASKPSAKGIRKCIGHMGLAEKEILVVGDQIFTDCIAAHRAGVDFFMVKPISDKETTFFKMKRLFEKPSINVFRRRKRRQNVEK